MSLLQDIVRATEARTEERRRRRPLAELERAAAGAPAPRSLAAALERPRFALIAEVKARSPSGGAMDAGNVERAPKVYESSPAVAALSVITNQDHFGGSIERLGAIRELTAKPILRKDFVTEPYQVIEARAYGADAILLMASLFPGPAGAARIAELFELARSLGMEALFEIGMGEAEPERLAERVPAAARVWGVNSRVFRGGAADGAPAPAGEGARPWRDPTTSLQRHERLRALVPEGRLAVAESGLDAPDDLEAIARLGYDAALVGTAFLRRGRVVEDAVAAFARKVDELSARLPQR